LIYAILATILRGFNMREIILVRHALVDVNGTDKIAAKDLKAWVENYDKAGLHPQSQPSEALYQVVNGADFLLTSTLSRAIASANFFDKEIDEKRTVFNELPIPTIQIPFFEFQAKTWLIILRLVLFFTNKQNAEIEKGVEYLLELSRKHKKVVLVGHGGINYYMHKQLLKQGWKREGKASIENWGMTKLYLAQNNLK